MMLVKMRIINTSKTSFYVKSLKRWQFFFRARNVKRYKIRHEPLNTDFKTLYRFDRDNVHALAVYFLGRDHVETRGGALSAEQKMRIFLRYVSDPGFQAGIGEEIGVHQSTVSKTISEVMIRILENSNEWVKFPSTNDSIKEAKQQWQERYHFPATIGALDCTHVRILKPSIHGDEYVNRKTFASLNVQLATCNAKEIFTSIDASWPGFAHDSRIWRNSEIRKQFSRRNNNADLLGDSGYGLEPWLMTPFRNPANDEQQAFNRLFKRERVIIERCFGQVPRRLPILQYIMQGTYRINSGNHYLLLCFT
jgi:AAA+ ATPase superfamily predicted ATPase